MEKVINLIEKILDNFNLGRAIIYTLSSSIIMFPVWMIIHLLFSPKLERNYQPNEVVLYNISFITKHYTFFFVSSYILSFCFVSGMYVYLDRFSKKLIRCPSINKFYTLLKDDSIRWLTTEYYRFLEAAYYIPFSFVISLWLLTFYFLLAYLLINCSFGDYVIFNLVFAIIFSCLFLIWFRKVVCKIYFLYNKAKINLIYDAILHKTNDKNNKEYIEDIEVCLKTIEDLLKDC